MPGAPLAAPELAALPQLLDLAADRQHVAHERAAGRGAKLTEPARAPRCAPGGG